VAVPGVATGGDGSSAEGVEEALTFRAIESEAAAEVVLEEAAPVV
jgi:hypothetical protein